MFEGGEFEVAGAEEPKELGLYRRPCVTFEHVGRFRDHGRRHQSRRRSVTDCADASEVMNISSVAGGDQRTRIDEYHEREAGNSARRISSDRSARSGDAAKLPK